MVLTRANFSGDIEYYEDINERIRNIKKELLEGEEAKRKLQKLQASSSSIAEESKLTKEGTMAENTNNAAAGADQERSIIQYGEVDPNQDMMCIVYPPGDTSFVLKSGIVQILPRFHGYENEDPHMHLKEFHGICETAKPQNISLESVKLRLFAYSLKDGAKDWLYYQPPRSIRTWGELAKLFLEKYYPASKAANLRKDICGIRQRPNENLYEYYERFKKLCALCPQHQITENLLMQYFYEGLTNAERKVVDAGANGSLVHMTPRAARALIEKMAANSQQFGGDHGEYSRNVSGTSDSSLKGEIDELKRMVKQLTMGKVQQVKACGICMDHGHPTDACPKLQEDTHEQVNAVGFQRAYNPYSNTYNPGWRDHPNFRYGGGHNFQQGMTQQRNPNRPTPSQSLEDIVTTLANNTQQFQKDTQLNFQETRNDINALKSQVGQLANSLSRLETQGKLPSQTVTNPRENMQN